MMTTHSAMHPGIPSLTAILSLILSDTKESDFTIFSKEDWSIIDYQ